MSLKIAALNPSAFLPMSVDSTTLCFFLDRPIVIGKEQDVQVVLVRKVIRAILQKFQEKGLNDRCELSLAGTYLQNLLVAPCPYNDADLKIHIMTKSREEIDAVERFQEDFSELVSRVELVVLEALESLLPTKGPKRSLRDLTAQSMSPISFGQHAISRASLDSVPDAKGEKLSIEISMTASRQDFPKYVLASDSFRIPFKLIEGKLASKGPEGQEAAQKFWMYSYEGDSEKIANQVREGIITSSNSEKVGRDGWFRVLKEMTVLGSRVLEKQMYQNFYFREVLANVDNFIKRKHLAKNSIAFFANLLFCDPRFLERFREEMVKRGDREGWPFLLHQILLEAENEQVLSLLKGLLPLFASESVLVDHLEEKHLRCKLSTCEGDSYVFVPVLSHEDKRILVSFLQEILEKTHSFVPPQRMGRFLADLTDQIISSVSAETEENLGFLSSTLSVVQILLPNLSTPKDKTDLALGSIKEVLKRHEGRLQEVPDFLWTPLKNLMTIYKKDRWKELLRWLIPQIPEFPTSEMQQFLDDLFVKLYQGNADFCDDIQEDREIFSLLSRTNLQDPLNFRENLEIALGLGNLKKAIQLVQYQGNLFGFLPIQPLCQKLFYRKNSLEAKVAYEEILQQQLQSEKGRDSGVHVAIYAYQDMHLTDQMSSFIENEFLLTQELRPLIETILLENAEARCFFSGCLRSRIARKFSEEKVDPEALCELLTLAYSVSKDPILEYQKELLKKEGSFPSLYKYFPQVFSYALKNFSNPSKFDVITGLAHLEIHKELRMECLTALLDLPRTFIEVQESAKKLLSTLPTLERLLFAKACMRKSPHPFSEDLFAMALHEEPNLAEAIASSSWNLESLHAFFHLYEKRGLKAMDIAEALFSRVEAKDYTTVKGLAFLTMLLPFLGKSSKEKCVKKNVEKVLEVMNFPKKAQEMYFCLSFLLREELIEFFDPRLENREVSDLKIAKLYQRIQKVRDLFFSNLPEKLERLQTLASKRRLIEEEKQESDFLRALLSLSYRICSDTEKQILLQLYVTQPSRNEINVGLLMNSLEDTDFLKTWNRLEIENGFFLLMNDGKCSIEALKRYAAVSYEAFLESPQEAPQQMIHFLEEESKEHFLSQLIQTGESFFMRGNKEEGKKYLEYLLALDASFFAANPHLYASFLKAAYLYLAPKNEFEAPEKVLLEKIGELIKKDFEIPEECRSFYTLLSFVYATLQPHDEMCFFKEIEKVSSHGLEELVKKTDSWSLDYKHVLVRALELKMRKMGVEALPLKVVCKQLLALEKELKSLKSEKFFTMKKWEEVLCLLAEDLFFSEFCLRDEVAACSSILVRIFLKNVEISNQQEVLFWLIKNIHSPRLERKDHAPTHGNGLSSHESLSDQDMKSYLGFLQNVDRSPGESLVDYIDKHALFLGKGPLSKILSLYQIEGISIDLLAHMNCFNKVKNMKAKDAEDPRVFQELVTAMNFMYLLESKEAFQEDLQNFLSLVRKVDPITISLDVLLQSHRSFLNQLGFSEEELSLCFERFTMPLLEEIYRALLEFSEIPLEEIRKYNQAPLYRLGRMFRLADLSYLMYINLYPKFSKVLQSYIIGSLASVCANGVDVFNVIQIFSESEKNKTELLKSDRCDLSFEEMQKLLDYAKFRICFMKSVKLKVGMPIDQPDLESIFPYLLRVIEALKLRVKELFKEEKDHIKNMIEDLNQEVPENFKALEFIGITQAINNLLEDS